MSSVYPVKSHIYPNGKKLKMNILPNDSVYYMYCSIVSRIFLLCATITSNVDELHKNSHSISRNVTSYRIEI